MKRRHQKAETVVSLMSIPGLDKIDAAGKDIHIGGTATLSNIIRDEKIRERLPAFASAVASISSPPLRNMGTIGGNLCVDTRCTRGMAALDRLLPQGRRHDLLGCHEVATLLGAHRQ
jgi:CO/xanthine dehydrogenase FAD-binding subunit